MIGMVLNLQIGRFDGFFKWISQKLVFCCAVCATSAPLHSVSERVHQILV